MLSTVLSLSISRATRSHLFQPPQAEQMSGCHWANQLQNPTFCLGMHVSLAPNVFARSMLSDEGPYSTVQTEGYGLGSTGGCLRLRFPAMTFQGASLAASEHPGTITGEHMSSSGDLREPPGSPFDTLFGKVCRTYHPGDLSLNFAVTASCP